MKIDRPAGAFPKLAGFLWVFPFAFLVIAARTYFVDIPFLDDWDLIPLLEKGIRHTLAFQDLWAFHNEHRQFFSEIVLVWAGIFTGFNLWFPVGLSLLIQGASFWIFTRLPLRPSRAPDSVEAVLVLSILFFSLRMYDSAFWAVQLCFFMANLFALAGIAALSKPSFRWRDFFAASFLGVLSAYSSGIGLAFWPAAFLLLLFSVSMDPARKKQACSLWVLETILVYALYFWGFNKPAAHPPLYYGLRHPLIFSHYVLNYIGGIFYPWMPALMGYLGILWLVVLVLFLKNKARPEGWMCFAALIVFVLFNAVDTAVVRAGFDATQALFARYVVISCLFWAGIYRLSCLAYDLLEPETKARVRSWKCAAVLVLVLMLAGASFFATKRLSARHAILSEARKDLLTGGRANLYRLYPDPLILEERVNILKRYGLSAFRNKAALEL